MKAADAAAQAVRTLALAQFKGQPAVLADFGLVEKAPKAQTAEQKAAAAKKRQDRAAAKKAALAAAEDAVAHAAPNAGTPAPTAAPVTPKKA